MKKINTKLKSGDFVILALTIALVIFGIIMIFSASYYWSISEKGQPYFFLIRSIIWAVTGFAIMMVTIIIDYHFYKKIAKWLFLISIILLVAVLFVGININGAQRWISIFGITIMPGEIAKLVAIIVVAKFLCRDVNRINNFMTGVMPMLLLCGLYGGLIMLQPNMSTAVTVIAIIISMMFVAGLKIRHLLGLVGLGALASFFLIFGKGGGYRLNRVTSFVHPFDDALGDGFQVVQGLLALGTGGLFGVGIGKSVQKSLYLPEPQNDFILAIIGEELGYIAVLVLFCTYLFLIWRGISIALNAPDRFGMLLASGITIMIGIQVLLNVAVVTSSMPPTGIILPFVSYGGNALWLFMGAIGILINISRHQTSENGSRISRE